MEVNNGLVKVFNIKSILVIGWICCIMILPTALLMPVNIALFIAAVLIGALYNKKHSRKSNWLIATSILFLIISLLFRYVLIGFIEMVFSVFFII